MNMECLACAVAAVSASDSASLNVSYEITQGGSRVWGPAMHGGDSDEVSGCLLQLGPVWSITSIWGISTQGKISQSLSIYYFVFK